jgi:hypothetical protein
MSKSNYDVIQLDGNALYDSNGVKRMDLSGTVNQSYTSTGTASATGSYTEITLTNAQLKALRATPITIVAAPGAGKYLELEGMVLELVAGTNALTESTANLAAKFTNASGVQISQTIEMTGFIDQTVNTITNGLPKIDQIVASTGALNQAIVIHNLGAGEFGGNAANDATLKIKITCRVHTNF